MKKFLTAMLCLVLCFTFLPKQTFAADSYTVTVSTNGEDYAFKVNGVDYKDGQSFTAEAGTEVRGYMQYPTGGDFLGTVTLSDGTEVSENGSIGRFFVMPERDVTLTLTVVPNPRLVGTPNIDLPVPQVGTSLTGYVTGANSTNLTYTWYKGTEVVATGATFTPTEAGSYKLEVTASDKEGKLTKNFIVTTGIKHTLRISAPDGIKVTTSETGSTRLADGDSIEVAEGIQVAIYADTSNFPSGVTFKDMTRSDGVAMRNGGSVARVMDMPTNDVTVTVLVDGLSDVHQHKDHLTYHEKKESTCEVAGIDAHYECSCGELFKDADATQSAGSIEELTLPLAEHTYGPTRTATEPTCEEEGETEHECTVCGYVERNGKIPAAGHKFGAEYVDQEPTCIEEGRKAHACSVCGEIEITGSIPKTAHRFGEPYVSVAPTCTEEGTSVHECAICGATEYADTLLPTGHDFGEEYVAEYPTCTAVGHKAHKCSKCDLVEITSEIPMIDHALQLASNETSHFKECLECYQDFDVEAHYDDDNDEACDICGYPMPKDPGTDPDDPSNPDNPGTDPDDPSNPDNPGTDPDDPSNPDNPGTDPDDPSNPDNPGTDPDDPSNPDNPGTDPDDPSNPDNPGTDPDDPVNPNPGTPNTGDDNSLMIWLSAMALSAAALLALLLKRRSEK